MTASSTTASTSSSDSLSTSSSASSSASPGDSLANAATAFARTPSPPYFAVIFASLRTPGDRGYGQMAERMVELAAGQPGFLGVDSARGADGFGITVSYWDSMETIAAWKAHAEHVVAQTLGLRDWYAHYELRVARVERAHGKPAA